MMGHRKLLKCTVLLYLIFGSEVYTKNFRISLIAKKVPDGYYCPADNRTVFLSDARHVCTHYCVSEIQCSMLSYHMNGGLCMLHKETCVVMVQATDQVFSYIMLYQQQNYGCVSWLPYEGNVSDSERLVRMNNGKIIMMRIHYNSEILPARLLKNSLIKTVSLVDGPAKVKVNPDSDAEFLVVSDSCSIVWVPYIDGNPMPPRAVVGGRKWNGGPLVVAALWTTSADMNKKYDYGYYDPESKLGYVFANSGPATNTSVDIMMELWDIGLSTLVCWMKKKKTIWTYIACHST